MTAVDSSVAMLHCRDYTFDLPSSFSRLWPNPPPRLFAIADDEFSTEVDACDGCFIQ